MNTKDAVESLDQFIVVVEGVMGQTNRPRYYSENIVYKRIHNK